MWLLHARNQTLKYFHSEEQVPGGYAILSHTWGEEEVTFDEIRDLESAQKKAGYTKIRYTCTQATQDGLDYAWVDTCK